ncbi:MAG: hypothetical protein ACOCVF_00350 [bacterium]
MDKKIEVLFYSTDKAGVNYYRIGSPAKGIEKHHSDDINVTIVNEIDFKREDIVEYLSKYDIIYYSKELTNNFQILEKIKKNNTKFVVDFDDYWKLDKTHPMFYEYVKAGQEARSIKNLKFADYVTTTTEFLANKISEYVDHDKIVILPNAINEQLMPQFKNNWKPDPNGLVRICYQAGSTHYHDIKLLRGVVNMLSTNSQTKNKFKIILGGWDYTGNKLVRKLNTELEKELNTRGIWNREMYLQINKSEGDINKVKNMPADLKVKYYNQMIHEEKVPIKPDESVYYDYEQILTDNYRLIKNKSYLTWLKSFEVNGRYYDEEQFARRWTKPVTNYIEILNEADIVIAPLVNNSFNNGKSNLKQVEAWTRKLPVVSSNVIPYNVDGVSNSNCILVDEKTNPSKHWFRVLKNLILYPNLRTEIGNNLYNDFSKKFDLLEVNNKRVDFLKEIA